MVTHWQLGVGPTRAICGLDEDGHDLHRCLTDCDMCEGRRDQVDCPTCIKLSNMILDNLRYFYREDGPHTTG